MVSSKNYAINNGPNAGVYCSYCGEKLTTQKDEETGAFYYQCTCADAKAEIILLTQKEELEAKIAKFYSQREKQIKRMQLLGHQASIQLQLEELQDALAELEDDSDVENDVTFSSDQVSEGVTLTPEENSLKMEGPKLPDFNH